MKRAFPLSPGIPFMDRFRIRVIAQNLPNYLLLLFGIFFANILLIFGLALPQALDHYQQIIRDNLLAPHQYILQIPLEAMDEDHKLGSALRMFEFMAAVETENETAEKFSAYTLRRPSDGPYRSEDVMVYGMTRESRYVQGIPESEKGQDPQILISSAYSDKYDIFAGDTIELQEKYSADKYRFKVAGVYDYQASICIFMEQNTLNQCFDLGRDYFSGYMSQTPITDIEEKYIGTEIDFESLTKVSRQLTISMGSMMYLVDFFAVAIFLVLIYILSKIIIEKNAQSISMAKILGYTGGEIARLYIRATTVVYLVCFAATIPLVTVLIRYLMKMMIRMEMTGWIDLYVGWPVYVEMIILGVLSYAVVALFEYRKIGRVPMDEALKNVE
jgi:putative ABC transport system permease protein